LQACRIFGVSRQSIYQQLSRDQQRQRQLEAIKYQVCEYRRLMPRLGTRKLYWLLKPLWVSQAIKLGRDGFFDYLRAHNLLLKPKRSYTKTTFSKHWMKKHPNLLREGLVTQPEQVFVSDITFVQTQENTHYLSLVTDACSRKIMGYELSREMKANDTVKALQMAISTKQYGHSTIHHSDRGVQYCSDVYNTC